MSASFWDSWRGGAAALGAAAMVAFVPRKQSPKP